MADETKKTPERPIIDMIFRLVMIYTAATCLFRGLQNWRNEDYLQAVIWFLITFSQIGQILGWSRHESKVVRLTIWIPLVLALILYVVSKML